MKKWKKYLGIWMLIGLVGLGLDRLGIINLHGKPTAEQQLAREKFLSEWNRLVGYKMHFIDNTMVVYVKNKNNPFATSSDFAKQYHPRFVNGESCSNLGISAIQVRNIENFDFLSGLIC